MWNVRVCAFQNDTTFFCLCCIFFNQILCQSEQNEKWARSSKHFLFSPIFFFHCHTVFLKPKHYVLIIVRMILETLNWSWRVNSVESLWQLGGRAEECCLPLGKAAWEQSGSRDGDTKAKTKWELEMFMKFQTCRNKPEHALSNTHNFISQGCAGGPNLCKQPLNKQESLPSDFC